MAKRTKSPAGLNPESVVEETKPGTQEDERAEPPSQPVAEVKVPKDKLTVKRADFQKLVYDLVHGYTGMWTGSAGKQRLFVMLGITDREEVERMYQAFSKEYVERQKK